MPRSHASKVYWSCMVFRTYKKATVSYSSVMSPLKERSVYCELMQHKHYFDNKHNNAYQFSTVGNQNRYKAILPTSLLVVVSLVIDTILSLTLESYLCCELFR